MRREDCKELPSVGKIDLPKPCAVNVSKSSLITFSVSTEHTMTMIHFIGQGQ